MLPKVPKPLLAFESCLETSALQVSPQLREIVMLSHEDSETLFAQAGVLGVSLEMRHRPTQCPTCRKR